MCCKSRYKDTYGVTTSYSGTLGINDFCVQSTFRLSLNSLCTRTEQFFSFEEVKGKTKSRVTNDHLCIRLLSSVDFIVIVKRSTTCVFLD